MDRIPKEAQEELLMAMAPRMRAASSD